MVNYDFNKKLEKTEFENLVRDIIQVREGVMFESFSVGPDGGIDFRKTDNDNSIIVQVKNIKRVNDLYRILKNVEVKKLKVLKPKRYILVTSIDLTPSNKERIKEILKDFHIANDDIIGGRDLNNYLGMKQFQYIEINYPNLWYDSGHVFFSKLDKVVHHDIYEESRAEYEEIKSLMPYYVPIAETTDLIKKLDKERFLLITGNPGIGKTSLARYIISYYIQKNDYNLVFTKRVSEANKVYDSDKKQIFFFDDFWGSSFKDDIYGYEDESKLGAFIRKISKTDNKILILTSRDYVLEQGLLSHGKLNDVFDKSKHTINLNSFSFDLRKNILIKLLDKSVLPASYIERILYNMNEIIDEEYFNPRILNDYINHNTLKYKDDCEYVQGFYEAIMESFKFYERIYNYLNLNSKLALYLIRTMEKISYENFFILYKNAFEYAINNTNLKLDIFSASNVIKQLDKCFINVVDKNGEKLIKFQNNSIPDFLLKYEEENFIPFEKIIIMSLTFFDQINLLIPSNSKKFKRSFNLSRTNYELFIYTFIKRFDNLKILNERYYHHKKYIYYSNLNLEQQLPFKLLLLLENKDFCQINKIKTLIIEHFNLICERLKANDRRNFTDDDLDVFIQIIRLIKKYIKIDSKKG